ncbi:hypothetical protein F5B21DRAFT_280728 [Xylaria acuta]|nr:hypothetical protein F5B21DRAFT_280728 [Xylaria acuta]
MPDHNLRLLSLDGGGVRGLSSLIILQQLMITIDRNNPPRPCEYFDLIGGTSTGGIIALMLGRLRMSIAECIDAYVSLSDTVFKKRKRRFSLNGNIQGRFDTSALEKAIKHTLVKHGYSEDELLRDDSASSCKVVVCAASKQTGDVVCLTTYHGTRCSSHLFNLTKIWEACRATSAATSFFDPIAIGRFKEEFIDAAALGVNNPVYSVWSQAQDIWGTDCLQEKLNCLVSIGTGMPGLKPFKDDIFNIGKTLVAVATETEKTAERFRLDKSNLVDAGLYYRFNVMKGLETVGLEESSELAKIVAVTSRYVTSQEVSQQMSSCVSQISSNGATSSDEPPSSARPQDQQFSKYRVNFSPQGVPFTNAFVPRPSYTTDMESVLLSERRFDKPMVFVLHGLGGMGKTQLAADFARKHHGKFSSVFWLDGRTKESLTRSIAACATRISGELISEQSRSYLFNGEGNGDAIVMGVMDWLSRRENSAWLLIFDNVDREHRRDNHDPNSYDIQRYFPGGHGSILITTRLSQLAQLGSSRKLDKVDDACARDIFQKWYRNSSEVDKLGELLNKLDGLPLALAQSAAYLRETGVSFTSYLQYYKKQWKDLMESQGSLLLCYDERNIVTTWLMSLNAIQTKNEAAINLFRLWAFLDNKAMSHELLRAAVGSNVVFPRWLRLLATDEFKFIEATRLLLSHSMIERVEDELGCYSVHPVVHKWASQVELGDEQRLEFLAIAVTIVGLRVPETKSMEYWTISRKILPHADACSYWLLAEQDRLDVCAKSRMRILDAKKADIDAKFEAAHSLADLYRAHRKVKLAEELYNYALEGKKRTVGPKHLSTLSTMNNLGILCQSLGRLDDAEAMGNLVLQGREEVLGPDHVETLGAVNNLALVCTDKDQLQEAEGMFTRALQGRQKAFGPDHLSTLRIIANLGVLYARKGNLEKARDMFEQALRGYEKTVGLDHALTLHVVNRIGLVFTSQGKLKEAERMYTRALIGWERHLGLNHISTLATVAELGSLYADEGMLEEARKFLSRAADGYKATLGPDDPMTRVAVHRLNSLRLKDRCWEI